jgi:hypothetical protein
VACGEYPLEAHRLVGNPAEVSTMVTGLLISIAPILMLVVGWLRKIRLRRWSAQ